MNIMHKGKSVHQLKEGHYFAEVPVSFEYLGPDWEYVIGPGDLEKIERVRRALKSGDVATAAKEASVYEMRPVAAE